VSGSLRDRLLRLTHWAGVLEKWTLVFLVAFLFSFDFLRVILRNFFATGLVWGDTLSKHLVLWIALLGASRATMEKGHILIDLIPRMLADRGKRIVLSVDALFSFVVCALLSYASYLFVCNEISSRTMAFGDIPLWWLQTIFPAAFAVMTARFGWQFIESLIQLNPSGRR